jgi:transaldolase
MTDSNPLLRLLSLGQSFWWDALSRRDLRNGEVARMRDEGGMRGITSNPAIFHSAIAKSNDYDLEVRRLAKEGLDREAIFWQLAVEDIREACEVLRPVYDASEGEDGYVSLEVDPRLAHDTETTVAEARRLYDLVDAPNLMIKIPGTPAGIPAIRKTLAGGIPVNVTLLFSQQAHIDAMQAYMDALEERVEAGQPVRGVASVASFFVSRVDTLVDQLIGDEHAALRGRAAVANARLAYRNFEAEFSGSRWEKLEAAGARVQRPLWASTSTKDPSYRDVIYVEELIGAHTVNTMPTVTVEAFADHGEADADRICEGVDEAATFMTDLEAAGVSMTEVTDRLLSEGVEKFETSFAQLLDSIDEKARELAQG